VNDGDVLDRTIGDLARVHPAVRSVSVVPVGLTRHSRVKNIRRHDPCEAAAAVEQCERWQAVLRDRLGIGFAYPSDELYLLAGRRELPPADAYDGFPALSNGVGLLRSMLDDWRALIGRRSRWPTPRKIAWVTGKLAAPALHQIADDWYARAAWRPLVKEVENTFFGDQVTVSGLLSGGDLLEAVKALPADVEDVVLPRGPFGFDGRCTLDGVSAELIGAAHPGRVHLASSPRDLLEILTDG
jgi:NifB/MoaA-like Fe-S oxidoreductase